MTPSYDALVFDLDGTLWDSSVPVTRAWNTALSQRGDKAPVEKEAIKSIMGLPHEQIFEKIFPEAPVEERDSIATDCYAEEIALIRQEGAELYKGVEEGIPRLAERYTLYLVSNCQSPYLQTFFDFTRFGKLFKDSECHGNTGLSKGDNLRLIIARNGMKRPAYIGDTSGDEAAARAAGMTYFHVDYGFGRALQPCQHFKSFDELVQYFLK